VLVYTINGGTAQTIGLSGVGAFSQSITGSTADFAQNIRLDVWLRDNAPAGRGEAYKRSDARSGAPDPGVSVRRIPSPGGDCNDGDDQNANNCKPNGNNNLPVCDTSQCARIEFTVNGFYENFECRLSGTGIDDSAWAVQTGSTFGGTATFTPPNWYGKGSATVSCTGTGAFGKQSSGFATW